MSRSSGASTGEFLRPSRIVWIVEFLVLIVAGLFFYSDWSAPFLKRYFSVTAYGLDASFEKLLAFLLFSLITIVIASVISSSYSYLELRNRISSLADRSAPMRAEEFLEMRGRLRAARMLSESEFTGVYILHNVSKGRYYVGQSVRVLTRINQHLTGHGNGDVYADFKYGDSFTVSTIPMQGSGYQSLNDLERDAITAYDAKNHGYNMTRGNRR